MQRSRWMRRFDCDAEAAVRLSWRDVAGCEPGGAGEVLTAEEGGVSHFHYWRDNVLLTSMYLRLVAGFLIRLPWLIPRRLA